ncbi:MAG: hypothetical protein MJZ59_02015 [Paludibacteraceae bacterium]|nr:hypothetical protein [Paludibacteraceae bacterium]
MVNHELILAHLQDQVADLALHRNRFAELTDEEWHFFLQQIEGYQRTKDKLPTFAALNTQLSPLTSPWWYPVRLSCEQCSSEATARYKAQLVVGQRHLIDLTGGAGVDTFFMGEQMETVDYVERDAELCRLARHNLPDKVRVHNKTAEEFLNRPPSADGIRTADADGIRTVHTPYSISERSERSKLYLSTIYIDPARRDKNGGKVFRIEDCTPNVVELLPRMRQIADTILIKFSPMLDISAALCRLNGPWQVHVVAVKNEVKEVIFNGACGHSVNKNVDVDEDANYTPIIHAVDLEEGWRFEFTQEEENNAISQLANYPISQGYIYEPNAAILKAGAYKLVGARYGLNKLDTNTHLYHSEQFVQDFPGRIFKIADGTRTVHTPYSIRERSERSKFNVLTRNYVMGAEELKKKLKVRDGGTQFIIGARHNGKPIMLLCDRIK